MPYGFHMLLYRLRQSSGLYFLCCCMAQKKQDFIIFIKREEGLH